MLEVVAYMIKESRIFNCEGLGKVGLELLLILRRSGTDIYKPFKAHNLEIAGSTPDLRNQ